MAALRVDTNVVSYIIKRDTRGMIYRPHLDGQDLFVVRDRRGAVSMGG